MIAILSKRLLQLVAVDSRAAELGLDRGPLTAYLDWLVDLLQLIAKRCSRVISLTA